MTNHQIDKKLSYYDYTTTTVILPIGKMTVVFIENYYENILWRLLQHFA